MISSGLVILVLRIQMNIFREKNEWDSFGGWLVAIIVRPDGATYPWCIVPKNRALPSKWGAHWNEWPTTTIWCCPLPTERATPHRVDRCEYLILQAEKDLEFLYLFLNYVKQTHNRTFTTPCATMSLNLLLCRWRHYEYSKNERRVGNRLTNDEKDIMI